MSRQVILGGGGFLGTNLALTLLRAGGTVRCFGRSPAFPSALAGAEWVQGDFRDPSAVRAAIRGVDVVFHLVSDSTPALANTRMVADIESNLIATVRLLEMCVEEGIRRVVFVSSGGTVYGRVHKVPILEDAPTEPITAYGVTKLGIERYLAIFEYLHGLDYKVLRLANPYGPFQRSSKGQGVVAAFVERILAGQPLEIWGNGKVVRDYIFVEDAAEALRTAAADTSDRRIFNIASGVGYSLNDLVGELQSLVGRPLEVIYRSARPVDVPVNILSVALAKDAMGWQPRTGLREGLQRTLDWARRRVA
jgi:UDP-glucose 4-epimerase